MATILFQAKARARARRESAGAAMLVVLSFLAAMSALGVYSLRTASREVRVAGFQRQSRQTYYLTEYGVLGVTHELIGKTSLWYNLMTSTPDLNCPSIMAGVPADQRQCRRLPSAEIGQSWRTLANATVTPFAKGTSPMPGNAGSIGSLGRTDVFGEFVGELTEPVLGPPRSGMSQGSRICPVSFTLTSTGITYPFDPTDVNTSNAYFGSKTDRALQAGQGIVNARAIVQGGFVPCP